MPEVSQISVLKSSLIISPRLHFGMLSSGYGFIILTSIPNPSLESSCNVPLLHVSEKISSQILST